VIPTDVSSLEQVQRLKDKSYETFGEVRTRPIIICLLFFFCLAFLSFFFFIIIFFFRRNRSTDKRAWAVVGGCPVQQCRDSRGGHRTRRFGRLEEGY